MNKNPRRVGQGRGRVAWGWRKAPMWGGQWPPWQGGPGWACLQGGGAPGAWLAGWGPACRRVQVVAYLLKKRQRATGLKKGHGCWSGGCFRLWFQLQLQWWLGFCVKPFVGAGWNEWCRHRHGAGEKSCPSPPWASAAVCTPLWFPFRAHRGRSTAMEGMIILHRAKLPFLRAQAASVFRRPVGQDLQVGGPDHHVWGHGHTWWSSARSTTGKATKRAEAVIVLHCLFAAPSVADRPCSYPVLNPAWR